MVDLIDIFYALIREIKKCIPEANHYLKLPESFTKPCFLYLLVFTDDKAASSFIKDTILDIQIIYFGETDGYSGVDLEDKLRTMGKLKNFLSQFNLQVKDRNLKFTYSFGEADEQLTINIDFKFKDELVNLKAQEEGERELIQNIYINQEEMSS